MKGKHDYSIKAIDESVNVLQESFFDIYFRQIGSLSFLMSKMEGLSENEKSKISALVERQSAKLNQSMELLNQLVSIVKSIDSDGKRIEALSFNIMEKTGTPIGSAVLPRARRKKADTSSIPVPNEDIKVDEVADNPVREEVTEQVVSEEVPAVDDSAENAATTEAAEVKVDASSEVIEVPTVDNSTETTTTEVAETKEETSSEVVEVPTVDNSTDTTTTEAAETKEETSSEVVEAPTVDNSTENTTTTETPVDGEAKSDVVLEIPTVTTENTDEPVLTPVGEQTEENSIFNQPAEKQEEQENKNLISGTPEEVNREMAEMFRKLPGMENIKISKNGMLDFNSILPPEVVEEMNATTGKEGLSGLVSLLAAKKRGSLPIQPVLEYENNGEAGEGNNEQSIFGEAKTEENNTSNVVPTVAPPAAPSESVVSANDITAEITDALQNINNSESTTSEVSNDTTSEGTEGAGTPLIPVIEEEKVEEEKQKEDSAFGETGLRRFINVGTQTRAILVSESQFNKLSGSRVTQEALLKFKHILPEGGSSATPAVVNDVSNMTEEEKKKTIEVMMADATELYNSGKVEEAQAMYDKISELNNTVVEG